MKPPLLAHKRAIWDTSLGVKIAVASVHPIEGREGYWLERQDYPTAKWRLNKTPMRLGDFQITGITVEMPQGTSPGKMIQGVFDAGITTPASIAQLFADLLGKERSQQAYSKPVALVKFSGNKGLRYAELTEEGTTRLRNWKEAGLLGRVSSRNTRVEAVEHGNLPARDALEQLCGESNSLRQIAGLVARQIDAMCQQWRGMSREDALVQRAKLAHKPPVMNALPAWIDPESQLAKAHPLRALRERMEADLAMNDPAWSMTDERQRAQRRLAWLTSHKLRIVSEGGGAEFAAAMDPETGRFSALRYWLTGKQNGSET